MKLHEVLDKAADVMTERGLAKETFEDGSGRVCLLGAIAIAKKNMAIALAKDTCPELDFLDAYYVAMHGKTGPIPLLTHPVVAWNDAKYTKESEVIAFLREAAIAAKEQETT